MKILRYPDGETLRDSLRRSLDDSAEREAAIRSIMEDVRQKGDAACLDYSEKFDGVRPEKLKIDAWIIDEAERQIPIELRKAIHQAYDNLLIGHEPQRPSGLSVQIREGVEYRQRWQPVDKVGLYVPGGTSPLFSTVLMLGVPSRVAGCPVRILCTPPNSEGKIHPAILFAAKICGITDIYALGGAQAIAAMTWGTKSVPAVHKIFGPGNQWVTLAKQIAAGKGVSIDMPAGPSEVAVIADDSADPELVAADLLAQAEHGPDSQAILFTDSEMVLKETQVNVDLILKRLPRRDIAKKALENSALVLCRDLNEARDFANDYAPEHLILQCRDARTLADGVRNAGSVFIGTLTPESAGDYAGGGNHTLPTNGYAKSISGLGTESFMKKIAFLELTDGGVLALADTVESMAAAEGLQAHALSMQLRREKISQKRESRRNK